MSHDFAWFVNRSVELARAYSALTSAITDDALQQPITVPWIAATLTVRDGLLQVLVHSGQHRAQVLSTLGERGFEVPYLDYVAMLVETAPPLAGA